MNSKQLTVVDPNNSGVKTRDGQSGLVCQPLVPVGPSFSGPCVPGFVDKPWGSEHIYQNNDRYCMKVLTIEPDKHCSMHFHLKKHETMLVIEGTLAIDYIVDKEYKTQIVSQWEAFTISPGLPHSLRAPSGLVRFIEASTPDYDSDSIRIG